MMRYVARARRIWTRWSLRRRPKTVRTDRLGLPVEYVPCLLRIDGPENDEEPT